ncbi:MAG TPA: hypothetical protein VNO43_11585 [Candidatus Eisenbacteria bacterium]|nr:hypothetical protein [Candidatus Eisenbacteria bacterium]
MPRVLVYGFGPYRHFKENITAKILKGLPSRDNLRTVIFPVRFQRKQFTEALKKHRPDVVLGLGQSSRRRIEIETVARNRRRDDPRGLARPIRARGPRMLPTTLDLRPGRALGRSRDAGNYVCNYSMYVILDEIERRGLDARFGFIHVPYSYELSKAARLIGQALNRLTRRYGESSRKRLVTSCY